VRTVAYCTAIGEGDREDWDFLLNVFRTENNSDERKTIISALGCSRDAATLEE